MEESISIRIAPLIIMFLQLRLMIIKQKLVQDVMAVVLFLAEDQIIIEKMILSAAFPSGIQIMYANWNNVAYVSRHIVSGCSIVIVTSVKALEERRFISRIASNRIEKCVFKTIKTL